MQRIEVKNFGPLKDVSLDIKDYMIFIGPQASGKSTLAKLIWFHQRMIDNLVRLYSIIIFDRALDLTSEKEIIYDLVRASFNSDFSDIYFKATEIKFIFNNDAWLTVTYSYNKDKFECQVSDTFVKVLNSIYNIYRKIKDKKYDIDLGVETSFLTRELFSTQIKESLTEVLFKPKENIFIPAGRVIYAQAYEQIFYSEKPFFKDSQMSRLSFLLPEYIANYKKLNIKNNNLSTLFERLSYVILKGNLTVNRKESERLRDSIEIIFENNDSLNINLSSSGQQETAWIIIILKTLLASQKQSFLIIEEPEAHLFPEAQRDLTYLISLLANQEGNQVLLTTHSPYILASLNNLLKAYTVGQAEQNKEAVGKIIDPLLWVNPDKVFVGYMENGEIRPILNPGLQQIEHDLLDNVSNDIMTKFDELLEIQYNQ